jgi:dsRNA-specific ribonuclease
LQNGQVAQGVAGSKRGAEQDAARSLLADIDLPEKSNNA